MKLNEELFEQIVTSLQAGEATTLPSVALEAGERRRLTPRLTPGLGTRVRLIPLTDSVAPGPLDLQLVDLSPGGVRFLHNSRISLDEQFVLMLPQPGRPRRDPLRRRVLAARREGHVRDRREVQPRLAPRRCPADESAGCRCADAKSRVSADSKSEI